ncbi:hypothetical protein [Halomonas cerina]|uniref:Uncharacterized protein n=1 Tax=Halomonas cerina TaxID=447424 RepID=A0A839V9D0_9GAMM|nr:hypothetical protein [Halomonas cerina]MBB3190658.1 hypothetical protein [Halomonas cerina]
MTPTDQLMLNRAAFSGDVRCMEEAGLAIHAIADVLGDEAIELNGHQREGLIQALKLAAKSLDDRAVFIAVEVLGEEGDDV